MFECLHFSKQASSMPITEKSKQQAEFGYFLEKKISAFPRFEQEQANSFPETGSPKKQ